MSINSMKYGVWHMKNDGKADSKNSEKFSCWYVTSCELRVAIAMEEWACNLNNNNYIEYWINVLKLCVAL